MALGDPGDKPHRIPGNPSPGLGGDNRQDLGLNHIPGNFKPSYGSPGDAMDDPVHVSVSPTPEEVRAMFQGRD